MSESQTFILINQMLILSKKGKISYFIPSQKEIGVWIHTFEDFVRSYAPRIADSKFYLIFVYVSLISSFGTEMSSLNIHSEDFAENWFLRFFVGTFPYLVHTIFKYFFFCAHFFSL